MADAVAAGNEDHGGGTDLSHEQGIVVSATDHFLHLQAEFTADTRHSIYQRQSAYCGRINVQSLDFELNPATTADFWNGRFDTFEGSVASLEARVAKIDFEPGAAGDTVNCTGFDAKDAGSGDCVRAT